MKVLNYWCGLLVVANLALAGCSSMNTVENANKEGHANMVTDQRVISDPRLGGRVDIVGVNTAVTPGGLLKVQVALQNHTHSTQRFLYAFEWFDLNGMQVKNVLSATLPEQLEPKESKNISGLAPTPACRDFRVKFIQAD